MKPIQNSKAS